MTATDCPLHKVSEPVFDISESYSTKGTRIAELLALISSFFNRFPIGRYSYIICILNFFIRNSILLKTGLKN